MVANINVTKCIWLPKKHPISPTLFEAPTTQRSELGHMIYANSITLTPGTITLRVDDGSVLVHALTESAAREVLDGEMDRRVTEFETNTLSKGPIRGADDHV